MFSVKTFCGAVILSAAAATPVFAHSSATHHKRLYDLTSVRRTYNQLGVPSRDGELNVQNFGFSGIDPSRPGGMDPSLHPSGS